MDGLPLNDQGVKKGPDVTLPPARREKRRVSYLPKEEPSPS